jgi:hypothetical protein
MNTYEHQLKNKISQKTSILKALDESLRKHGFAGPTDIPQLVFLSTLTRMNDIPVSLLIKGTSGSGKSHALKCALRYVPETIYKLVHGVSEKALLHMTQDMRNRFLVCQEAAGFSKEGFKFLRQVMTEGEAKYLTVNQTKDGHEGKELSGIKGPMGVIMTTTSNRLHNEDENRFLSLYVDQSPEQIKRTLMALENGGPSSPTNEELQPWHKLHNEVCAGSQKVKIPFRDQLLESMPTTHTRVLRDAPKMLSLLKAHALLHRATRKDEDGVVVATVEDYETVYNLIKAPLSYGLQTAVAPHISDCVSAAINLHNVGVRPVTLTAVSEKMGREPGAVSRSIAEAVKQGYLINDNPGQGRQHAYRPGERALPNADVLPSPQTVCVTNKTRYGAPMENHWEDDVNLPPAH